MKMHRGYLVIASWLLLAVPTYGQALDPESNWYKETGRQVDHYSRFDFSRYSASDIQSAKHKYLQILSGPLQDDWSGSYSRPTLLGRAELTWSDHGFVYAYIYHTLANIDYGRALPRSDSVSLVSEKWPGGKPNAFLEGEHIKVKFGERHLLVPKSKLDEFAIFAAGLDVPDRAGKNAISYTEYGGVWEKVGDEDKNIADVPTYPAKYASLIRKAIQAKVLSVGRLVIIKKTSRNFALMEGDHVRLLILSGGSRNGVKVGMTFWADQLEERVEIVSAGRTRSVARLVRSFIDGKEFCRNDDDPNGEAFPCREPKIGMRTRTKTRYF